MYWEKYIYNPKIYIAGDKNCKTLLIIRIYLFLSSEFDTLFRENTVQTFTKIYSELN
jgi:hypothetical protein